MNFIKTLITASALIWGFTPDIILAKSRLSLLPVSNILTNAEGVSYEVELPCGANFEGTLVRKRADRLEVGAVIKSSGMSCTSLPGVLQRSEPRITISKNTSVVSIPEKLKSIKVKPAIVNDIRIVRQRSKRPDLKLIYENPCGETVGAVFTDRGDGRLQVGMLVPKQSGGIVECVAKQKIRKLDFLKIGSKVQLSRWEGRAVGVRELYDLRIGKSKVLNSKRGLKLAYVRRCHEYPIGIALRRSRPAAKSEKRVVRAGVLLARFYNHSCIKDGIRPQRHHVEIKEISLDRVKHQVVAMAPTKSIERFTLKSPFEVALESTTPKVHFLGGCRREVASIYGYDDSGRLSVGVLQTTVRQGCTKPIRRLTLGQPVAINSSSPSKAKIYPMHLRGLGIL